MRSDTISFVLILSVVIIDSILFVMFGQKTVSKLRKNPDTKDALGGEFMSGRDIFNITIALGFPRELNRILKKSAFAPFNADVDLLEKHLTRFDLILAKVHFSLWMSSVLAMLIFMLLYKFGVFE